jgi:hypothetical protein
MFEGPETAARLSCDVKADSSSFGTAALVHKYAQQNPLTSDRQSTSVRLVIHRSLPDLFLLSAHSFLLNLLLTAPGLL